MLRLTLVALFAIWVTREGWADVLRLVRQRRYHHASCTVWYLGNLVFGLVAFCFLVEMTTTERPA